MKTELILYKQQLALNPNFDLVSDYGWDVSSIGVDWEKEDRKITKLTGTVGTLEQSNVLIPGVLYRVIFMVSGRTTGSAAFKCSSTGATIVSIGVNGRFDSTFIADDKNLYFETNGTFDGSISKFSITQYPDVYNVDLESDVAIPLNFSIDDIFDVSKRKTTFSKTFTIPGTKHNNTVFSNVYEINSEDLFVPTKLSKCIILNSGITVFEGSLSLDLIVKKIVNHSESVEYSVTVFGNLVDIFEKMSNKNVKDLDFGRWDHEFTKDNIFRANGMGQSAPYVSSVVDNSTSPTTYYENQTIDYSKVAASITGYSYGGYNRVQVSFGSSHSFAIGDEVTLITENSLLSGSQTIVFISGNNIVLNMLYDNLTNTSVTDLIVQRRTWLAEGYFYPMQDNGSFMRECINGDKSANNLNANGELTNGQLYTVKFLSTVDDFSNLAMNPVTGLPMTVVEGCTFLCDDGGLSDSPAPATAWYTGSILLVNDNLYYGAKATYKKLFSNHWYKNDFIPHIYAKEVWDKIFQNLGYYYSSDVLSSNLFRRLVLPMSQEFNPYLEIPGYSIYANMYVFMNDWLPNISFKEFVTSILNLFNLVVLPVGESNDTVELVCRSTFFNSGYIDIEADINEPIEVKLSNSFLPKGYHLKYKDSSDFFNTDYNTDFGNINNGNGISNSINRKYGDYYTSTGNIKASSDSVTELIFEPTVMAGNISGIYDTFNSGYGQDKVFSACFSADVYGNNAKRQTANRLLIAGLRGTNYPYSFSSSLGEGVTYVADVSDAYGNRWYPVANHIENIFDAVPTYDLNFGILLGQYFPQTFTLSDWEEKTTQFVYWGKYLLDITNINGKTISGYFRFSITDIYNLDFRNVYRFKNYTMKLNKIMDWNVNGDGYAKAEFTLKNL